MLTFRLDDPPPSVNRAWRMFRGRMVRSPEFKAWEKVAILHLTMQARKVGRLPELCYWRTEIHVPRSKSRADIDNFCKAIHDALVRAGITPDDRYLVKTTIGFWTGDYLIVNVKHERLDEWLPIMAPSREVLKRLRLADQTP